MKPAVRALLAIVAGVLLPLSLAPFDWWPLGLISAGLLFWSLAGASPKSGLLLGWLYGVAKYAVGTSWVYVSIHEHGHASPALSSFLVLLFVCGLALFPALACWLYSHFFDQTQHRESRAAGSEQKWLLKGLSFTAVMVLLEWALTWVLTGFPWLYYGYAQLDTMLSHWAPVGGVLLVSYMLILSASMMVVFMALIAVRQRGWQLWIAGFLVLLPWAGGALLSIPEWVHAGVRGQVALVQGNIDQETKWRQESVMPIIRRYSTLSENQWDKDLVIWPEAAITLFRYQAQPILEELSERAHGEGATLVLGIPDLDVLPGGERVFRNSAIALGDGSGLYIKQRLVPFGEYVPLENWLRGLIRFFDLPMSHAEAGPPDQPLLTANSWRLAMAICYEIVYPELVRRSAADSDLIVTLSNDTWFGASIGPLQHMQMARMRALENGRYLLRSTNNGVTAIVDERGKVMARLPQFVPGVLQGDFVVMQGHTPFSNFGFTPWLVLLALWLCLVLFWSRFLK